MLGRKKNNKIRSYSILLSIFLVIGPDTVLAERKCFTASQIAGIIFVTSFTTFFAVIVIAILLWYFYRNRTDDKNFIAKIENNVTKSGKVFYNERTNEIENKAVDGVISSSFTDKMTSCSSLTGKYDNDMNDVCVDNQKVQLKQERRCVGSQSVPNDLSTNDSMNILEDVVRCLLDKDTSSLGFQIAQRSDGICISYVEPNGPADRSGNIFVGDKIKELTITFENMPISDALTILSCASTYKIRLELERAIINDTNQPDCTETTKYLNTSSNPIQQRFSLPHKSYSTSDLAPQVQKAQIPDKAANGGSFMSKQKYQLPRQRVINTIKEEVLLTTPENLSTSSPSADFTKKAEFIPVMTESIISEETIIISDESSEPPVPVLKSFRTSSNEISLQSQNSSYVLTPKIKSEPNCTSNSTPSKDAIYQQQLTSQISLPSNDHPVLTLIPERNHKIDEIKCNGFSEFVERSHFIYSNASIKDDNQKNCVEFCELIEPKRESIVIEFEEDQEDGDYQQIENEMTNLPKCNDTYTEPENDLCQINSNVINDAPMATAPNREIIDVFHAEKDAVSENTSNVTDIKCNTSYHPAVTTEVLTDLPGKTDIIEKKFNDFNTEILSTNNVEQTTDRAASELQNHLEINEFNVKYVVEDRTSALLESPINPRKINNNDKSPNEISQRSSKRNQLRKLSSGNCGINETGREVKKLNGTADDLKDEGQNRSKDTTGQRSSKWSPKLQSHIPIVTRTPSTKSKNRKVLRVEGSKVANNSTHLTRSKTSDDIMKNHMNGASLYIAKKEALRKTHLPFSKLNKSDEGTDLAKERKARLEANQALLQRQQDELRTLGILP